jgi:hypothetical protein
MQGYIEVVRRHENHPQIRQISQIICSNKVSHVVMARISADHSILQRYATVILINRIAVPLLAQLYSCFFLGRFTAGPALWIWFGALAIGVAVVGAALVWRAPTRQLSASAPPNA